GRIFDVAHVLVCESTNHPDRVRVLVHWNVDRIQSSYEYDVRWTPCEVVVRGNTVHYAQNVQHHFPRDRELVELGLESYSGVPLISTTGSIVGHFVVMDTRPMPEPIPELAVIQLQLARAAAELERRHVESQLRRHLDEVAHVSRLSTLGELAGSIAHELNQPLAAVANFTQAAIGLLRNSTEIPRGDLTEILEGAENASRRASEIVKRMRSLVSRRLALEEVVDVGRLVEETARLIESEYIRNSVRLTVATESEPVWIAGDRVQLQQVLVNLLRNAAESVEGLDGERRAIVIRVERRPGHVAISVSDQGPGIDEETVERIFDPFYTTKSEGMGMGLAISRSIVESHGGRLLVTSRLNEGTMFSFSLRTVPAPDEEEEDLSVPVPRGRSKRGE
ncbi:MAG: GHKL domain-containing protein, partial [Planctomycetes bacterium]|nr:GHKL domain-containing protein [Planctomycetota bacterium]